MKINNPISEKIVYLLIGAKGSGKSYIGNLLEETLGINFLQVEQRLINHVRSTNAEADLLPNDGYDLEFKWIEEILQTGNEVISEATGSSKYLPEFISRLQSRYDLYLVRIYCPLDVCFKRVKKRTQDNQFQISDDLVKAINITTHNAKFDWSLEIDNTKPASDDAIIEAFNGIR